MTIAFSGVFWFSVCIESHKKDASLIRDNVNGI